MAEKAQESSHPEQFNAEPGRTKKKIGTVPAAVQLYVGSFKWRFSLRMLKDLFSAAVKGMWTHMLMPNLDEWMV